MNPNSKESYCLFTYSLQESYCLFTYSLLKGRSKVFSVLKESVKICQNVLNILSGHL